MIKQLKDLSFKPVEHHSLKDRRHHTFSQIRSSLQGFSVIRNKTQLFHSLIQSRKRRDSGQINSSQVPTFENQHYTRNAFEETYDILQRIGEGANGIVRKCRHKLTKKIYAVKILRIDTEHVQFLRNNFISIKALRHLNIIKYKAYYLNVQQHKFHLVMEYLPFPSLEGVKLDEDEMRYVFHCVFDALAYMHGKHICHRDIKPENILYDKQQKIVKIIDFGVSKDMKRRGRYEHMLTFTGTQYYKAPEMLLGGGYDEKIDNWAAGITIYKIIMGVTPFESEYHSQTNQNILTKEIDFQVQPLKSFSPLVKDLLNHLLKKNKKERLSSSQAKQHLWFTPTLAEIGLLKSDVGIFNFIRSTSNKGIEEAVQISRKNSSYYESPDDSDKNSRTVSKNQRQNFKRWLSIISQDDKGMTSSEAQFDLIDSQGQQCTSIGDHVNDSNEEIEIKQN